MDMGLAKLGLQHGLAPIYGTPNKKKEWIHKILGKK